MTKGLLRLDLAEGRSGRAKHERLRDHFVRELLAGRLKPGQALPSENCLMQELGVARMTVRQAMGALEEDGLIRRVQGKGSFVQDDARQRLKRGQDIFALVVIETRGGYYPSLLHGFEKAVARINHQAIICSTNEDVGRQADIILQLMDKKVGGVALNPTITQPTPPSHIRQLQEHGIPVVFVHRGVEGATAPLLRLPYAEEGRMAARALLERGHRRVVFFTSELSTPTARECETAFRETMQATGDASVESVAVAEWAIAAPEEPGKPVLERLFSRADRPTAIFTTFDSMAETIYLLLMQMGLRVPEDVSLISEGGTWRQGAIAKRLTSVVVDEAATGDKAVSLLHEMRCGARPIDDNEEFTLQLGFYEGETLGAASLRKCLVS